MFKVAHFCRKRDVFFELTLCGGWRRLFVCVHVEFTQNDSQQVVFFSENHSVQTERHRWLTQL